jgi:hypothetical protein
MTQPRGDGPGPKTPVGTHRVACLKVFEAKVLKSIGTVVALRVPGVLAEQRAVKRQCCTRWRTIWYAPSRSIKVFTIVGKPPNP